MRRFLVAMLVVAALLGACGDDDDPSSDDATADADSDNGDADSGDGDAAAGDDATGGDVVDPAPPGEARVVVDGLDITFDEVLPGGCSIADDSIAFGFAAPDGVTTLAGGLNGDDGEWQGSLAVNVPNPEGEGFLGYYPQPTEGVTLTQGSVAVDGSSMSYSGPMLLQPVNDGTNPPPVEVGEGTISATC